MAFNNTNTPMDWDSTIENDSTFTLLPEGVYAFTVTGFERARHNGSAKLDPCPKAMLTIEIDGGALGRTTVTHNLFIHRKCEGLLCDFFTSIGARKRGEPLRMPWQSVIGARGRCEVYVDKWVSDRDGQNHESNRIRRFLEPNESAAPVQQTAPTAGGWKQGAF